MNKIISLLIFLIIFSTSFITVSKPVLHKQFMIIDSNYTFIDESANTQNDQFKQIVKKEEIKPEVKKSVPQVQVKTVSNVIKKTAPQKNIVSKTTQVKKEPQKTVEIKKEEPIVQQTEPNEIVTEPVEKIKQQEPVIQEPQIAEIKELTEEEEIIAWNKWRSDLQNQVMKDTDISAPLGVAFKFSFTVDKFGNLSNVKVWSTTSAYSDMAVRVIKPVLMGYQGKPILNFPQGTKRIITNVAGGFVMSTTTGYSSPDDYSDYERVVR